MKMIFKMGSRSVEILGFFTKYQKRLKILKKVLVVITLTVYNDCG